MPACRAHPAAPIAPRLKFNRHIRKALLDVRLAPGLSATPERAYDELRGSGRFPEFRVSFAGGASPNE